MTVKGQECRDIFGRDVFTLFNQFSHLSFLSYKSIFNRSFVYFLLDFFRNFANQNFFERFGSRFTLGLEFADALDSEILSFFQLIPCEMVLNHSVICFHILRVNLQAGGIVKFRFINLISFEMSER